MKILGESQKTFIVELEKDEMAKLLGASWTGSDDYKKHKVEVGSVLKINNMWEDLSSFRTILTFNDKMIKEFQSQIDRLKKIKVPKIFNEEK